MHLATFILLSLKYSTKYSTLKRGEENEMGNKATGHLFKKQTREKTKNVSNAVWMLKKSEYAPFSFNYFFSFVVEFNFVFTQSVYLLNI